MKLLILQFWGPWFHKFFLSERCFRDSFAASITWHDSILGQLWLPQRPPVETEEPHTLHTVLWPQIYHLTTVNNSI